MSFSMPFSLSGVPEIEYFVGRSEELNEIKDAFQGDEANRKIVLLQGLGGIGKTQLAVEFIKQQRDSYSAVFWLNGTNEDMLKESFSTMAKRLYNTYSSSVLLRNAAESKNPDQAVEGTNRWLSAAGNTRWILIFDNVNDPKLPGIKSPHAYDIRTYFPAAHQGSILITTRSAGLKIGKVVRVRKFVNIWESIAILARTSERQMSVQGMCQSNI